MSAYADLAKLLIVLALALGIALFGRSCGKTAGLKAGEKARTDLQAEVADLTGQLNGCITSVNFANHVADQEAAEAKRQEALAQAAAARALQAEQDKEARIAEYRKLLEDAKKNPDAAAQLRIVLHPSIPLR